MGQAQLPISRLWTVFPPGGKAGSSFEVVVTGLDLDDASQIYFSHSNLVARPKIVEATGYPDPNRMVVTIATNVPPGVYEARVAGRFGLSNPRAFAVGDLPELAQSPTNHAPASASEIPLGHVVNGHADPAASDFYKFHLARGERALIECQAKAIDSRLDPVLVLFDEAGREVESNRKGGLLDFMALAPGTYTLQVHDIVYRGGIEFFYRLVVGTGPYIDFIFPPSGAPGTKGHFVVYGRNLPGGAPAEGLAIDGKPLERLAVEIELPADPAAQQRLVTSTLVRPADSFLDGVEYRLHSPRGVSNPVLLSFASAPVIAEQAANGKPEAAQPVTLPCEFVGQFHPNGDQDWIAFAAKKGAIYWLEVFSQRLGFPTDPFVLVQRVVPGDQSAEKVSDVQEMTGTDANIGDAVYNTATRDPAWRFEVKEDGNYRVGIRNLFGRTSSSPRHLYRLSLRNENPDFRLVAMAQAPPTTKKDSKELVVWTPFLRRGETTAVKVMASRRDNFNGEITVTAEGLPPGVRGAEARIAAGQSSTLLLLTASEDAPGWLGPVKILGKAKLGDSELVREARGGSMIWNVGDPAAEIVESRMTRDFVLAVAGNETAPISIEPDPAKIWEMSVAGKLSIPLKVARRGEFNAAVKLKAFGVPALESVKEIEVDGKTNRTVLEIDLAQSKIPVGTHTVYLQTQTAGKYLNNPAGAKAAEEEAKQAKQTAADAQAAAKKAEDSRKAAEKAAGEASAEAKTATEAFTAAAKLSAAAEADLKAATEKASALNGASEPPADTSDLAAATKRAAARALEEAAVKSKHFLETRAAAETKARQAAAKSGAALEAKKASEQAEAQLGRQAKNAEAKSAAAADRAKQATQKAQPKDVTVLVYSAPIELKVTPAPLRLASSVLAGQVEQGGKIRIPISLTRLYNFHDAVELSLISPKGVDGLSAAKLTIPQDQIQADFLIEAAAGATPGDHPLIIQAMLKFNNQPLQVDQPVKVTVIPLAKK